MNILNAEEKKENSKTTYNKRSRQVSTRLKHPVGGYQENEEDEFSNRFGEYLGGSRAGGMSMRSGSMSQAPKLSIHRKKPSVFGRGKMSMHQKKSLYKPNVEILEGESENNEYGNEYGEEE